MNAAIKTAAKAPVANRCELARASLLWVALADADDAAEEVADALLEEADELVAEAAAAAELAARSAAVAFKVPHFSLSVHVC